MTEVHGFRIGDVTYATKDGEGYIDTWRVEHASDDNPVVRVHIGPSARGQSGWLRFATTGTELQGAAGLGGVRPREPYGVRTFVNVEARGVGADGSRKVLAATVAGLAFGDNISAGSGLELSGNGMNVFDIIQPDQEDGLDNRVSVVATDVDRNDERRIRLMTSGVEDFRPHQPGQPEIGGRQAVGNEVSISLVTGLIQRQELERMALGIATLAFNVSDGMYS